MRGCSLETRNIAKKKKVTNFILIHWKEITSRDINMNLSLSQHLMPCFKLAEQFSLNLKCLHFLAECPNICSLEGLITGMHHFFSVSLLWFGINFPDFFCCIIAAVMVSDVGIVGHFPSLWCKEHFRKNKNVLDMQHPHRLWFLVYFNTHIWPRVLFKEGYNLVMLRHFLSGFFLVVAICFQFVIKMFMDKHWCWK